jgi:hypothetical protein
MKGSVPGGKFVIACSNQGRAKLAQLRPSGRTLGKKVFNTRAIAQLDRLFRGTGKLLKPAEIKDSDEHMSLTILPEIRRYMPFEASAAEPRRSDTSSIACTRFLATLLWRSKAYDLAVT